MKLLMITAFAALSFIPVSEAACVNGKEFVKGYTNKNGKQVKGYYRSCADGDKSNNFGKADYPGQHPSRRDADNDGVPNYADRDDDNDGIHDNYDASSNLSEAKRRQEQLIILEQRRLNDEAHARQMRKLAEEEKLNEIKRRREQHIALERQRGLTARPPHCAIWIDGYFRQDDGYVRGHWRTCPDGDKNNNFGKADYPGQNPLTRDADNDGIPNYRDRDDNNDGISDNGRIIRDQTYQPKRYRHDPVIIIQDQTTESAL